MTKWQRLREVADFLSGEAEGEDDSVDSKMNNSWRRLCLGAERVVRIAERRAGGRRVRIPKPLPYPLSARALRGMACFLEDDAASFFLRPDILDARLREIGQGDLEAAAELRRAAKALLR